MTIVSSKAPEKLVITSVPASEIPRYEIAESYPFKEWDNKLFQRGFICGQGHIFSVIFDTTTQSNILPMWECPTCETVAFDYSG